MKQKLREVGVRVTASIAIVFVGVGCSTNHCSGRTNCMMKPLSVTCETRTNWGAMPVVVIRASAPVMNVFPVVLLHEITGPSPACLDFAGRLAERGSFVVYVPVMFGRTNESGWWPMFRNFSHILLSCRWHTIRAGRTSPAYREIPSLVEKISEEHCGANVGAIGMCLTGSWPLALMADSRVTVGALCQPALPFFPWTKRRKEDLALSESDLMEGMKRIRQDHRTVLGFRFAGDGKSTSNRFDRVRRLCGSEARFVDGTISLSRYGDRIDRDAHSVFCGHYCDEEEHPTRVRLDQLITEFRAALAAKNSQIESPATPDKP